jgi:uncharacterized membrane protein
MDMDGRVSRRLAGHQLGMEKCYGYSYCVDNWCVKDPKESMFFYNQGGVDFHDFYRCDLPYEGIVIDEIWSWQLRKMKYSVRVTCLVLRMLCLVTGKRRLTRRNSVMNRRKRTVALELVLATTAQSVAMASSAVTMDDWLVKPASPKMRGHPRFR